MSLMIKFRQASAVKFRIVCHGEFNMRYMYNKKKIHTCGHDLAYKTNKNILKDILNISSHTLLRSWYVIHFPTISPEVSLAASRNTFNNMT